MEAARLTEKVSKLLVIAHWLSWGYTGGRRNLRVQNSVRVLHGKQHAMLPHPSGSRPLYWKLLPRLEPASLSLKHTSPKPLPGSPKGWRTMAVSGVLGVCSTMPLSLGVLSTYPEPRDTPILTFLQKWGEKEGTEKLQRWSPAVWEGIRERL